MHELLNEDRKTAEQEVWKKNVENWEWKRERDDDEIEERKWENTHNDLYDFLTFIQNINVRLCSE